jgi:hypothetical protein
MPNFDLKYTVPMPCTIYMRKKLCIYQRYNSRANESGHQKEGWANTDRISFSRTLHILLHFMSALYTESLALVFFFSLRKIKSKPEDL